MKRLKDGHVIAALGHVASKRQPRWARSDDGDLNALRWRTLRDGYLSTLALIVGGEALQVTDGHGRLLHLHMHAATFALLLLRTDAATDGWQCACFFQYAGSLEEVAALDVLNERGDLYAHRATLHAGRRHAVEATLRLAKRLLFGQALVHLFVVMAAIIGVELVHLHPMDGGAFLGFHALSKFLAPRFGATVGDGRYGFHAVYRFWRSTSVPPPCKSEGASSSRQSPPDGRRTRGRRRRRTSSVRRPSHDRRHTYPCRPP